MLVIHLRSHKCSKLYSNASLHITFYILKVFSFSTHIHAVEIIILYVVTGLALYMRWQATAIVTSLGCDESHPISELISCYNNTTPWYLPTFAMFDPLRSLSGWEWKEFNKFPLLVLNVDLLTYCTVQCTRLSSPFLCHWRNTSEDTVWLKRSLVYTTSVGAYIFWIIIMRRKILIWISVFLILWTS